MLGTRSLCTLSILCCFIMPLVLAKSYDYGINITEEIKAKRASSDSTLVTTGMPLRSNGSVPVRYEIRDLQKNTDKWELYILALDLMQYTDQSVISSWFSISSALHRKISMPLRIFSDCYNRHSWCTL